MITPGIVRALAEDLLDGVHQPRDTYKLALYTAQAELSLDTTAYSPTHEVVGSGYVAGGVELGDRQVAHEDGHAVLRFADAVWPRTTLRARGALLYNQTAQRAMAVFDFGREVIATNGPFLIEFKDGTAIRLT